MKRKFSRWYLAVPIVLLALGLPFLVSCISSQSSSQSEFYNAGNSDLSVTGAQLDQYVLFSFDTTDSALTMALPSAADIVDNLQSPFAGELIGFAVAADGNNTVTLIGGTNVAIEPGASTVAGNTTVTMYCVLDSVTSGSEAVTIY